MNFEQCLVLIFLHFTFFIFPTYTIFFTWVPNLLEWFETRFVGGGYDTSRISSRKTFEFTWINRNTIEHSSQIFILNIIRKTNEQGAHNKATDTEIRLLWLKRNNKKFQHGGPVQLHGAFFNSTTYSRYLSTIATVQILMTRFEETSPNRDDARIWRFIKATNPV